MTDLVKLWPNTARGFSSISAEIVATIFASALVTSYALALRISVACTPLTASELFQIILSISAVTATTIGLVVSPHLRRSFEQTAMADNELISLTCIDALTGLLGRSGFEAVATDVLEETGRARQPVSALLCDIDAFRSLNEKYGAEAGDRALKNLAEVLEQSVGRHPAIVGRQGGDEFAILLPSVDLSVALTIAQRICETCEARAVIQRDLAAKFTISVGVGTETSDASQLRDLLRQADAALYRAKRAGGNQVASRPGRFQRCSASKVDRLSMLSANFSHLFNEACNLG
jgi:diguanylate cyclase (GGDEF)-like protein